MRAVSLQPTATEFAYALGAGRRIVGVSHECTWPPAARRKPVVSRCRFDPERMSSAEIDAAVAAAARTGESLYEIDGAALRRLRPDLVLTQDLCEVCAVPPWGIRAVLQREGLSPRVISLHAHDLEGMFRDLRLAAEALGRPAGPLERALRGRLARVAKAVRGRRRRRVFCLEWLDPPFASGHWVPEMVRLAGGRDPLAAPGRPSRRTDWSAIAEAAPEVLFVLPCGFTLDRAERELATAIARPEWSGLPAVRSGEVYLLDGPAYFNGAGPRLVDGVELLASLVHPGAVPRPRKGWRWVPPRNGP